MHINLTLKSDLCAASGHGYAAVIDTDIVYDQETGLPYIPAKRMKGCLREIGLEILAARQKEEDATTFYELFGEAGAANSGLLNISDGKLNYAVYPSKSGITKHTVLNALTTLRYGTRMEATAGDKTALIKKTQDQSLRSARVLNKGEVLTFEMDDIGEKHANFLKECCQLLRHIGSNRTRGWGEVECVLADNKTNGEDKETNFEATLPTQPQKLESYTVANSPIIQASYKLTLNEPVISSLLSGGVGCEGHIPGSMLMGYFAGLWIKTHMQAGDKAHECPIFNRIFIKGGVKFSFAYPGVNVPFYPAPASIKTDKMKKMFFNEANEGNQTNSSTTSKLGGYANIDEFGKKKRVNMATLQFESAMHHARPYNRGLGSPLKDNNVSSGAFYSYTALSAEQCFYGHIEGHEADLDRLFNLLPDRATIRLGRSRTAQYGSATFNWKNKDAKSGNPVSVEVGGKICVTARSPLILCDNGGNFNPSPELLAEKLSKKLGYEFEVDRSFVTDTKVAGYNAAWLLPRPQMPAITGGSAVVLRCTQAPDSTTGISCNIHVGLRTGEGFGHVFIETLASDGAMIKGRSVAVYDRAKQSHDTSDALQEKIAAIQYNREWEKEGIDLAKSLNGNIPLPSNAQLGRLLNTIQGKDKMAGPNAPHHQTIDSYDTLHLNIKKEWKDPKKQELALQLCDKVSEKVFHPKASNKNLPDNIKQQHYLQCIKAAISQIRQERRKSDD